MSNATRGAFSNGLMDSMGAGIKPNGEGGTGIEELKKPSNTDGWDRKYKDTKQKKKSTKPSANSNQAIKPGMSIKKLN